MLGCGVLGLGASVRCCCGQQKGGGIRLGIWGSGLGLVQGLGFGIEGQVEAEDLELRKIALGIQGDLLVRVTVPSLTPDIPRP